MKRFGMLFSSLALAGALATSSAHAQEVTLDVLYAFPAFAKFHEPIAQEFMKRHPEIKIAFRAPAPTYDDGHQTMMRQAVTNQLPDVYYSGFHLLSELARPTALGRTNRRRVEIVAAQLDTDTSPGPPPLAPTRIAFASSHGRPCGAPQALWVSLTEGAGHR